MEWYPATGGTASDRSALTARNKRHRKETYGYCKESCEEARQKARRQKARRQETRGEETRCQESVCDERDPGQEGRREETRREAQAHRGKHEGKVAVVQTGASSLHS